MKSQHPDHPGLYRPKDQNPKSSNNETMRSLSAMGITSLVRFWHHRGIEIAINSTPLCWGRKVKFISC